jgi:ABC-type uncharacterized transport system substrate-binding protein
MRPTTIGVMLTLALSILAAPLTIDAQQPGKVPRIGHLMLRAGPAAEDEAFKQGLHALGWIEGQNLAIEYRWADGQVDRLPLLAEELVRLKVDCIVAWSTPAVQAAKDATQTIPIVMTWVADPLGSGFVASLAQPGGNITGTSLMHSEVVVKRLELLRALLPSLSRVAFLAHGEDPVYQLFGLDHGVGHLRSLSITRQRHWLTSHFIATRQEGLRQVF